MQQPSKITMEKIETINPDPKNPRAMTEAEEGDIRNSLRKFELKAKPLVVNKRTGLLLDGHQRLKVAKALGFTHVPVLWVDLEPEEATELGLRLNKNQGHWDWDLLALFDKSLLADVGFDGGAFDQLLKGDGELSDEGGATLDDEVVVTLIMSTAKLDQYQDVLNSFERDPGVTCKIQR